MARTRKPKSKDFTKKELYCMGRMLHLISNPLITEGKEAVNYFHACLGCKYTFECMNLYAKDEDGNGILFPHRKAYYYTAKKKIEEITGCKI